MTRSHGLFTVRTAKGSHSATTLREVCEWQAEHQGAVATIVIKGCEVEVDVNDVDFDPDDIDSAVSAIEAVIALGVWVVLP